MTLSCLSSGRVPDLPALAAIWLFLSSSVGIAQPCRGLERFGTFDVSTSLTDRQIAASLRNWFCAQNFPSLDAARGAATAIGMPSPDISRMLGYDPMPGQYTPYESWKIDYCQERSSDPEAYRRSAGAARSAAEQLRNQADDCAAAPGLHVWQTFKPDPLMASFTLSYQGQPQGVPAQLISFAPADKRSMRCTPQLAPGPLPNGMVVLECRRATMGAMDVYFRTTVAGSTNGKVSVPFVWWWVSERDGNRQ